MQRGRIGSILCERTICWHPCISLLEHQLQVLTLNSLKALAFRLIRKLIFHGNNFQDLPDSPLFGSVVHEDLQVLNISANYIVNLHNNALKGAPNIKVLDLSNNEIVLNKDNINFLSHTPRITQVTLVNWFLNLPTFSFISAVASLPPSIGLSNSIWWCRCSGMRI